MDFWKGVFSEPAPVNSPSTSRVVMGFFAVAAVTWVSYVVYRTHAIPSLWDIAMFVSSPYLVNQGKAMIGEFKK